MSVTTDPKPPYDAFRDEYSLSEGLSFDSFIITNDSKSRRKPESFTRISDLTPIQILLRSFLQCCIPRARSLKKIQINASSYSVTTRTSVATTGAPKYFQREDKYKLEESESESDLDSDPNILWYINLPYEYEIPILTESQRLFAILLWGIRMEFGSSITERHIRKIIDIAKKQKEDVDTLKEYRRNPELQLMKLCRNGVSTTADESINEIMNYYTKKKSILGIICKARCFGFYCYAQNSDVYKDITLFDSSSKYESGPKLLGFSNIDQVKSYILNEYSNDKESRLQVNKKFRFFAFQSRVQWQDSGTLPNPTLKKNIQEENDMIHLGRLNDPKYDGKLIYGELIKATTRPKDKEYYYTYQNNTMYIDKTLPQE
ncbi:hypothetical protein cand_008050 [Cryptosporidium andersoni]|uniref:Uncharacterized protein n=1 Tax=Cryptosporidium andersoni TaxID=117008 RepID=A0A1J4MRI8_9CRYT|nr:hypothetical protein cand_008050 [Cryptosporidium andersoni]